MKRPTLDILWRGLAMGAADIIPGVSGGTIAFITGIYDRLITGIRDAIDHAASVLTERSLRPLARIDWPFFIPLALGIVAAFGIGSLFVPRLITAYPGPLYGFFFGLILASAVVVFKKIHDHSIGGITAGILGALVGAGLGLLNPGATAPSLPLIGLIGLVASSAMLLPGVSGSFILLLFGAYAYMLEAIARLDLAVLSVFALGAAAGLALLSHALGSLLERHPSKTYYALTGLMVGALQRPGRIILENSQGTILIVALLLAATGVVAVIALERAGATPDVR